VIWPAPDAVAPPAEYNMLTGDTFWALWTKIRTLFQSEGDKKTEEGEPDVIED